MVIIIITVSKQNLKTKKMSIFYEYSNFKDQSVYTQFLPDNIWIANVARHV